MRKTILIAALSLFGIAAPAQADIKVQMLEPIVKAKIDLAKQKMNVVIDGEVVHSWKISSGRRGYSTPTGSYYPYRMHKMWYSRKYDNAPMPHAVFFRGGYAVHGTKAISRLGRPASHGCIRLHPENAKKFYDLVRKHGRNRTLVSLNGGWNYKATKVAKKKKRKVRGRAATQRVKPATERTRRSTRNTRRQVRLFRYLN
ncbi:MAG: L,D-transpeptidase [Pseudomonadota bacterium]